MQGNNIVQMVKMKCGRQGRNIGGTSVLVNILIVLPGLSEGSSVSFIRLLNVYYTVYVYTLYVPIRVCRSILSFMQIAGSNEGGVSHLPGKKGIRINCA